MVNTVDCYTVGVREKNPVMGWMIAAKHMMHVLDRRIMTILMLIVTRTFLIVSTISRNPASQLSMGTLAPFLLSSMSSLSLLKRLSSLEKLSIDGQFCPILCE